MTKLRNMIACLAIGTSAALGCAAETAPEQSAAPEMAQEGSLDVAGSIQRYEQASQLDPANHKLLLLLAHAYEQNRDWENMASTMSRAVRVAPDVAVLWQRLGYALLMQAHAGGAHPGAIDRAEEALKICIAKDPNMAECFVLQTFTNPPPPACPACGGAS
jgi:cytochrome c-type biogenesis protein CcmH/NrfG